MPPLAAPPDVRWLAHSLTAAQQRIACYAPDGGALYVHGLPGTGKSTALQAHLAHLVGEGCAPQRILVLVPQRAHVQRLERDLAEGLCARGAAVSGGVDITTFAGLCRRSVALFWPAVAEEAGFAHPEREPLFLTIETSQYYLWRLVEPLVRERGYFSELAIRRERLLSQLIDNLNKAALVGFPLTEIAPRLRAAWIGQPSRLLCYDQAQECATRFRAYCLEHNLLDFSLTCDLFARHLMANATFQAHLNERYRHLLVDNLEENVPIAHDLVGWAMARWSSAVLAQDDGAGYRLFLGADARGACDLGARCGSSIALTERLAPGGATVAFGVSLARSLAGGRPRAAGPFDSDGHAAVIDHGGGEYWVAMVRWVARRVADLVAGGAPPGRIAILAPYVTDVLRFTLSEELTERGIGLASLRPSAPMRNDAVIRAMVTLARLAHPEWEVRLDGRPQAIAADDAALALAESIADLDPVRAHHLAAEACREGMLADLGAPAATSTHGVRIGRLWARVGYQVAERYEELRAWLQQASAHEDEPLDLFFARLFGDLLSRPGYAFYRQRDRARVYGRLVESSAKFAQAVVSGDRARVAAEHLSLILSGVSAAEYVADVPDPDGDAAIVSPAYAYLTRDLCSDYQIWMDLSSEGWWHRPNQPLTHPYVLSRRWPAGRPWTDEDEDASRRAALSSVVEGLASRCAHGILLASSRLGIGGEEQAGPLERAVLRALAPARGAAVTGREER